MPTTNTNFTTLITAIDTKAQQLASSTTDPKDLVFLGKAVEALNVADTVSSVIDEGDTQTTAVNTAGTTQVANVQSEGATQVAAVAAQGANYAQKSQNLADLGDAATALTNLGAADNNLSNLGNAATARSNLGVTAITSTTPADGQVLTYDAATAAYVNRAATGGGNATLTSIDDIYFTPSAGWTWHTTYVSPLVRRGGYTGNIFGHLTLAANTNSNNTAAYANAVTVNPATGALTASDTNRQLWENTSYAGTSTTWSWHPYGTGAVYYGGNNAWPGQSAHAFGYGTAYLNDSGVWNQGAAANTSADHGSNGTFYTIPTSATSGRWLSAGYAASDSKMRWRNSTFSNNSFSIGSLQNPNSGTSTAYGMNFIGNKDATLTANTPVSGIQYKDSADNKKMLVTSRDGQTADYTINEWAGSSYGFLLTNGNVVIWSANGANYAGSAYNNLSAISTRWPLSFGSYSNPVHVVDNKFMKTAYANDGRDGLVLFEINPTTYEATLLEQVDLNLTDYDLTTSYTDFSVGYDSNGSPAYIIGSRRSANFHLFKTFEWPFS